MAQYPSNKTRRKKEIEREREKTLKENRYSLLMLINHLEFVVVDLVESSISDGFLEYVDLINVYSEIILH